MDRRVDGGQYWCWDCGLVLARLGMDTEQEEREEKNE